MGTFHEVRSQGGCQSIDAGKPEQWDEQATGVAKWIARTAAETSRHRSTESVPNNRHLTTNELFGSVLPDSHSEAVGCRAGGVWERDSYGK